MSAVVQALPAADLAARPVVHKFGGSSLADADGVRRCVEIMRAEHGQTPDAPVFVVVSAARGVTDALLELAAAAQQGKDAVPQLHIVQQRLCNIARHLLSAPAQKNFGNELAADITRLEQLLARSVTAPQVSDEIAAHGELWSMRLFASACEAHGLAVATLDARDFLRLDTQRAVDWQNSARLFDAATATLAQQVIIVPGFIARAAADNATVTLGRNGSDWSASIVGRLADAAAVTIWTDVAGVLEADPDVVPEAQPHRIVARDVAIRLAEAGAHILHPATLAPLHDSNAQLWVRSSFDSAGRGTEIPVDGELTGTFISARADGDSALVTVIGAANVPRAVIALANARIGFTDLRAQKDSLQIRVAPAASDRTQRTLHHALCRHAPALNVVLLGTGKVGSEWLRQLAAQALPEVRLLGVANSRARLFDAGGIAPATVAVRLQAAQTVHVEQLGAERLAQDLLRHCEAAPVIVDATASEAVARRHAAWLAAGIHVVTANKLAAAHGWVQPGHGAYGASFYGDAATVGAGLPVLAAIRRLRAAGDTVTRIEGVLSGSLASLFHGLQQDQPFSTALLAAQQHGLTEPDPRHDLSGADVARKLAIIAAAAGLPGTIPAAESLVVANVDQSLDDFLHRLPDCDASWRARVAAACNRQAVLRYVASLESDGTAFVGVREVGCEHPLAQTRGADNCVAIYSQAYAREPLTIRGPGAGVAVTARALFADLADVLARSGAG